jgi:hypothetical protein
MVMPISIFCQINGNSMEFQVKANGLVHLGFLIDTKTHTFCKGPSEEHSSYDFCQMFKKKRKKKKFALW